MDGNENQRKTKVLRITHESRNLLNTKESQGERYLGILYDTALLLEELQKGRTYEREAGKIWTMVLRIRN